MEVVAEEKGKDRGVIKQEIVISHWTPHIYAVKQVFTAIILQPPPPSREIKYSDNELSRNNTFGIKD